MSSSRERGWDQMSRRGVLGVGLGFALGVLYLGAMLVDLHLVRSEERVRRVRELEVLQSRSAAPRGTIYDRKGQAMAWDRAVMDLRAELILLPAPSLSDIRKADPTLPASFRPKRSRRDFTLAISEFLDDVGRAVRGLPEFESVERRQALRENLGEFIRSAFKRVETAGLKGRELKAGERYDFGESVRVDILLLAGVDDPRTIQALRALDGWIRVRTPDSVRRRAYRAFIHPVQGYAREVLDRALLEPVLGRYDGQRPLNGLEIHPAINHWLDYTRENEEGVPSVDSRYLGKRTVRRTAGGMPVLQLPDQAPQGPLAMYTTLDVDLMQLADEHLMATVERVIEDYEGPPEWGGVVLVHVETGEIVATASYSAKKDGTRDLFGAYTPMQRSFTPGSVVKPLLAAIGLQLGAFSIDEIINCSDGVFVGGRARRTVPDDHPMGRLSVDRVLVQSSNRGAARLGVMMGREGLDAYIRHYAFGESTGIEWFGEYLGHGPLWKRHHDHPGKPARFAEMNDADFGVWYGPSVSFGYEMKTSILQIARAYLSMIHGQERELRLVRGVTEGGQSTAWPEYRGERFLGRSTREQIFSALSHVPIDGTARNAKLHLAGQVREFELGDLAGKTGTSQFAGRNVPRWDGRKVNEMVRTSTFAGFAPAHDPEYLCVCVFQKVDASNFYGGAYAAPVAMGLLLDVRAGVRTGGTDRSGSGSSEAIRSTPRTGRTRGR